MLKLDYFHRNCKQVSVDDFIKNDLINEIEGCYGEATLQSVTGLVISDLRNLSINALKQVVYNLDNYCCGEYESALLGY